MNYLEKITEIYCFVSVDKGGEGVIAYGARDPKGIIHHMPLVAADKERLEELKVIARRIVQDTGQKIKLVKFTTREELEEITK